jgi:hypothetical protein
MKHVTFLRKGIAPFENYDAGMTGSFDDAIATMLIAERFVKETKAPSVETKLIRFVKNDRIVGFGGCFGRNEVAGFPAHIADAIVAQGFGVLHDAGKGAGVPLSDSEVGMSHAQEVGETDAAYAARGGDLAGALDPVAYEARLAARAQPKGKIRSALGV